MARTKKEDTEKKVKKEEPEKKVAASKPASAPKKASKTIKDDKPEKKTVSKKAAEKKSSDKVETEKKVPAKKKEPIKEKVPVPAEEKKTTRKKKETIEPSVTEPVKTRKSSKSSDDIKDTVKRSTAKKEKPAENKSADNDKSKKIKKETKAPDKKNERKNKVENIKDNEIMEEVVKPKVRRRRTTGLQSSQIAICTTCGQESIYDVKEREKKTEIKDVTVEYMEKYAVCSTCGKEVYVPALVSENKQIAEAAYETAKKKKPSTKKESSEDIAKELAKATISKVRASRASKASKQKDEEVDDSAEQIEQSASEGLTEEENEVIQNEPAQEEIQKEAASKTESKITSKSEDMEDTHEIEKVTAVHAYAVSDGSIKDSPILGKHFKYSKLDFVVLRDYGDSVLAVVAAPIEDLRMEFHDHSGKNTNNWANSSLRKYLNNEFIERFNRDDLERIETDLTADTGETEYGTCVDYVSMPWTSLLRESFYIMPEYELWTWTVTPFAISVWEGKMSCTIGYHKALYNEKTTTMLNIAPMIRVKKAVIKI